MAMWTTRIQEKSKQHLMAIMLLLFFVSEAISKYGIRVEGGKSDIPRYIKFAVYIVLTFGLWRKTKSLIAPLVLAVIFCVGQIFLANGFNQEMVVSFSKLLFPIFLLIYFNHYPIGENERKSLFQVFEALLILNGVFIFVGFIWEIPMFRSYFGERFGYNGLFITSATSSYVYAVAIFYFLLKLKRDFLKSWKTYFVIACAIFTGTKILYIALIASLFIYLICFVYFSKQQRKLIFFVIMAVCAAIAYFFFFEFGIFNQIRQNEGLLSAILSYRDDLFMEQTLPFIKENWSWANYLFGGISELSVRSQMGFIDVFLFWGILGGLYYLFTFYKSFVTFHIDKSGIYIILSLGLMVFLAGNFFENASIAIYLLILKEKLLDKTVFTNLNTLNG